MVVGNIYSILFYSIQEIIGKNLSGSRIQGSKRHRIPHPGAKRHRIPDPQHCLKAADLADVGLELGVNGLDVLLEALAVRECPLAEVAQLGARPLGQFHRLLPQVHHRVVFQLTQLVKA
jgi:hypothetical protein